MPFRLRAAIVVFIAIACLLTVGYAKEDLICAIYFTKIGCPVCAKTDPVILGEWPLKHKGLVIIEYVFEKWTSENASLLGEYALNFGFQSAVPAFILEKEQAVGLPPVFDIEAKLDGSSCRLLEKNVPFSELNLNELPAKPKIWANGRLLVRLKKSDVSSDFLRELLFTDDLEGILKKAPYKIVEIKAEPAPISYGEIEFKKAFKIADSWILKCNDDINGFSLENNVNGQEGNGEESKPNTDIFILMGIVAIIIAAVVVIVLIVITKK